MEQEIVDYLNEVLGRRYRPVGKTASLIRSRIKEGYTFEDFKRVIDVKAEEWGGGPMEMYLRPTTLFIPKHFDSYLNQPFKAPKKSPDGISKDDDTSEEDTEVLRLVNGFFDGNIPPESARANLDQIYSRFPYMARHNLDSLRFMQEKLDGI